MHCEMAWPRSRNTQLAWRPHKQLPSCVYKISHFWSEKAGGCTWHHWLEHLPGARDIRRIKDCETGGKCYVFQVMRDQNCHFVEQVNLNLPSKILVGLTVWQTWHFPLFRVQQGSNVSPKCSYPFFYTCNNFHTLYGIFFLFFTPQ